MKLVIMGYEVLAHQVTFIGDMVILIYWLDGELKTISLSYEEFKRCHVGLL